MSFFGFNTELPRDGKGGPPAAPSRGMFDNHDPFGGLSRGADEGETLNFDETYDGLGSQLDEAGDTFNDDTFGGDEPVTREGVGRNYDFAGQTARAMGGPSTGPGASAGASARPMRTATGYEAYRQPEYIPKLEADASIWGKPSAGPGRREIAVEEQPPVSQESANVGRKMMSLE